MIQLNRRHKVGIFLTAVTVGSGLLLDLGVKESVGIALIGLAVTWLVASLSLKRQRAEPKAVSAAPSRERQGSEELDGSCSIELPQAPKAKPRASWLWMGFSLLMFMGLLGVAIFNQTVQLVAGESEKAGEALGGMLIPLIFFGFLSKRAWEAIMLKEPAENPVFRQRHRLFNVVGGAVGIVVFLTAFGFGITAGERVLKNRRIDRTLSEMEKLGPKNAELRQQIKTVMSKDTPTFDAYYDRSVELEKVLDDYDTQEQKVSGLFDSISTDLQDDPKLAAIIQSVRLINKKDMEVVKIFRQEIEKTKELRSLPASKQTAFYLNEIMPLEREAKRIADEELAMVRDAEQKGVRWPSDVKALFK